MKTSFEFRKAGSGKNWVEWESEHIVWLLDQLNKAIKDGGLGPDPETPECFQYHLYEPGSIETPWTMRTIEQWRGAAAQTIGSGLNTGMYEVGGVMLERNPSAGDFNNYITAVIDGIANPFAVSRKVSTRGNLLVFDEDADRSRRTIYEIKCDRMKTEGRDRERAELARRVMKRECKKVPDHLLELPNSLGAMFISEAARLPLMLPLGLMLLDLIEKSVVYGRDGVKQYTWKKMMSYTKDEGEGRMTKAQLHGGKHPMMHQNSIREAGTFKEAYNAVTFRSISIVVIWLQSYIKKHAPGWETQTVRTDRAALDKARAEVAQAESEAARAKAEAAQAKTEAAQAKAEAAQANAKGVKANVPNAMKKFLEGIGQMKLQQFGNETLKSKQLYAEFYNQVVRPALVRRSTTLDLLL